MTLRFHRGIREIPEANWRTLLGDKANPFVGYGFLCALEDFGAAAPEYGWTPQHLGVYRDDELVAVTPLYLKHNSFGEFVFDWGWAEAYRRHELAYYPKLLSAVPFTPVPGPRLLLAPGIKAAQVLPEIMGAIRGTGLSSCHWLFVQADQQAWFQDPDFGLLHRYDWQFHWHNDGYPDFDAFLSRLNARTRKKIRHERKFLADQGIRHRRVAGTEATPAQVDLVHDCYLQTFAAKGNLPVLDRACLAGLVGDPSNKALLVIAELHGDPVAAGLFFSGGQCLYGRYWGCTIELPFLHFETCYYQGIEYCIEQGLRHFDPGVQGEHKFRRGFSPAATHSFHWIANPAFRDAIARHLNEEDRMLRAYRLDLEHHSPYRHDKPDAALDKAH